MRSSRRFLCFFLPSKQAEQRRATAKKPVNSTGHFLQPAASHSSDWGSVSVEQLCLWEDLTWVGPAFWEGLQPLSLSQLLPAPSAYSLFAFAPSGLFLTPLSGFFSLSLTPLAACPSLCSPCSNMEKGRIPGSEPSWLCSVWCLHPWILASLPKLPSHQ